VNYNSQPCVKNDGCKGHRVLHGRYDLLSQTAEIKTARIVESNSINHGGRLSGCMNYYFGVFQSKKMKNYYLNWCIRNADETDSDFDDIISNSFEKKYKYSYYRYAYYCDADEICVRFIS